MGHQPDHLDAPEHYEIRVRGRLAAHWSEPLGGMQVAHEPGGATLIHGPADQAALHAILRQIRDLGLDLLSVSRGPPR